MKRLALVLFALLLPAFSWAGYVNANAKSTTIPADVFEIQKSLPWGNGGNGFAYPIRVSPNGAVLTVATGSSGGGSTILSDAGQSISARSVYSTSYADRLSGTALTTAGSIWGLDFVTGNGQSLPFSTVAFTAYGLGSANGFPTVLYDRTTGQNLYIGLTAPGDSSYSIAGGYANSASQIYGRTTGTSAGTLSPLWVDGQSLLVRQNSYQGVSIMAGSVTVSPSNAYSGVSIVAAVNQGVTQAGPWTVSGSASVTQGGAWAVLQGGPFTVSGSVQTSPSSAFQGVTLSSVSANMPTLGVSVTAAVLPNAYQGVTLVSSANGFALPVGITNTVEGPANFQIIEGGSAVGPTNPLPVVHSGYLGVSAVAAPTLTKSTQGTTGYSVQQLRDAGRTEIIYSVLGAATGATNVDTLLTLSKTAGATMSSGSSFVVTSGKKFRITSLVFGTQGHATATLQSTIFMLKENSAGAVTANTNAWAFRARCATPATTLAWDRVGIYPGDGYEIAGDGTLQIGVVVKSTYTTNAPTVDVTISGYEY